MQDSLRVYNGSSIFSMDVSPDGQWFVLGRTHRGEIRNMRGKLTGTFAPNELVECVEISNDGKRLAVGILGENYNYNELRVYDVESWNVVWSDRRYQPPWARSEYWSIRFTADDSKIIVADRYGTARVYDARTGVPQAVYYDVSGIAMASFSRDGKLAVIGNGNGCAVVFDATTGIVIDSIRVAGEGEPVDAVAFVSDGDNIFALPRMGAAGIWEISTGRLLRSFTPYIGRWSADFSPDGISVAMGGDYVASIWDLRIPQRDLSDSVWSVVFPEPTDPEPTNPEPASPISLRTISAHSTNEMVALEYEVTGNGRTQLYLTDILGCRVATLVNDVIPPGRYVVQWNATEQASGMFFCVLQTPGEILVKQLMVKR
jgi:WD40 repeat protein